MTPFPGASEPKPTFQEVGTPSASVQYFKFIRGSGAPRVPRAAARCALLLLLLALLLLLLLLLALLLLAARCCARARAPARPPVGPPAGPPARRQRAADLQRASAAAAARQRAQNQAPKTSRLGCRAHSCGSCGPAPGLQVGCGGCPGPLRTMGPTPSRRCAPKSLREVCGTND